jgi:hypothetical protein
MWPFGKAFAHTMQSIITATLPQLTSNAKWKKLQANHSRISLSSGCISRVHWQLNGSWQYDTKKKEINITLEQVQTDGSLFKMPLQIAVISQDGKQVIHTLQLNEKQNKFTVPAETAPDKIILDPNQWVLMDAKWVKK